METGCYFFRNKFKMVMKAESKKTIDHKEIQKWAEQRNGKPARVAGTGNGKDAGLLRINFPGGKEDSLEEISWEDFFEKFDKNNLAFLYQEKTASGKTSRFSKIVNRDSLRQSRGKSSARSVKRKMSEK
jgi:hypothetical protein